MASATITRRDTAHPSLWTRTAFRNEDWFDEDQLEEMRTYFHPIKRIRLARSLLSSGALVAFALAGGGRWAGDLVGGWWGFQLLAVIFFLNILMTAITTPFSAWVTLSYDKRHGLSNQTPGSFATDVVKEIVISTILETVIFVAVYAAIRSFDLWWFIGWAAFMALQVVLIFVYPILILPRFNKFTPLEPGELRERIEEVARLASTEIEGIYVMDASKRSRRGNAFVAGFGKTKRVVLFDTILEMPTESIANIVAHEIGHYRLHHTLLSLPFVGVLVFASLLFTDAVASNATLLDWVDAPSLGDAASLPLFLIAFGLAWTALGLAQAWWSRYQERAADLEALELLGNPTNFMAIWPRLVTLNKAELEPSWWARLNHGHPEVSERMAFGVRWAELNGVPAERPPRTRLDDPLASVRPDEPAASPALPDPTIPTVVEVE
jgi:STE24 endopeptidase